MSSDKHKPTDQHCLSLHWAYGMNSQVPAHNMTLSDSRTCVLYACSNTAVWYDCLAERETLLQGHRNEITCTAVSADKKWVVTADAQENVSSCSVIVWDMRVQEREKGPEATPVQVWFHYSL